jgi:uncharacterized Fe-S cluster-containing radical SAM superfamily protein
MYDPIVRGRRVAAIVCRDDQRRYYRFRAARFYGGIATADCVGCNLACHFCWSWRQVADPEGAGQSYSPLRVADRLVAIARKKGFQRLRISGNEPTLGRRHLLAVLGAVPQDFQFILETNGILLGHDQSFVDGLARFPNLHVRVSLKGTTEEEFSRLTGARTEGFRLQLAALENLSEAGVSVHPAAMVSFSPTKNIEALQRRLSAIAPSLAAFEVEELALYGEVERRLRQAGIDIHRRADGAP